MALGGGREAVVKFGADNRSLDSALSGSRRRIQTWGANVKGDISRAIRGGFAGLSNVAGFAGIAGLSLAAKNVYEFEKRLTRLGIQARLRAGDMAGLRKQIYDTAVAMAQDPDELLKGLEKFVSLTGDVAGGRAALESFGRVATATGADVGDLATTAAALSQNMGIAGDEMEKAFSVMLTQGKDGAVELKDMAQLLAGLTPQFQQFGNKGVAGLAELGAELQIVRHGFGSSTEAATGLQSLMTAFVKNAKRLRGIGVNVFNTGPGGVKQLRSVADITFDLIKKSKGNPLVLQKVLGRVEAYQALLPLMQSGRAELQGLIDTGLSANEVGQDFATYMDTAAGKTQKANAMIKRTFSDLLAKNLDKIAGAAQLFADALGFMAQHAGVLIGAWALLRGGGMISGLGAALAGGAGPAAASNQLAFPGMGGPAAAGRRGSLGGALQGAGVGLVVATTLGKDLGVLGQTTLVTTHAMAGFGGALGGAGFALSAFADIVLGLFAVLNQEIDQQQQAIATAQFGESEAALALRYSGVGSKPLSAADEAMNEVLGRHAAAPTFIQQSPEDKRKAAVGLLQNANRAGALDIIGSGSQSLFNINSQKLDAALKGAVGQGTISKESAQQIYASTLAAQAQLATDPELRAQLVASTGKGRITSLTGEAGLPAPEGPVAAPHSVKITSGEAGVLDPRKEEPIHVDVRITTEEGLKATSTVHRRRKP